MQVGTMKTISTTREASPTIKGRLLIRDPVDRLFEQARSWRSGSDSGLAEAPTTDEASGADEIVVDATTDDALGTDDMCGLLDRLARCEISPERDELAEEEGVCDGAGVDRGVERRKPVSGGR